MQRIENYVGGRTVLTESRRYFDKYDPRTGEKCAEVACSEANDVAYAARSCAQSLEQWQSLRPTERGRILFELGRVIRNNERLLGDIESHETGKPGQEMPALIDLVAQFFEYYGGIANAFDGELVNVGKTYHSYVRREPLGVVGVILPWNAPLHQAARAIAPALAAGNAVLAKPSEHTSGSLVELARLAITEAGLPPGVLNVVLGIGPEVGPAMVQSEHIRKISLTGSVRAGCELGRIAAERALPLTLELGGKSANIVFEEADIDAAASGSARAFTWNSGQWCAAGTRLLVQESIQDRFVPKLIEAVRQIRIGPEHGASAGPITTLPQYQRILSFFDIAKNEGITPAIGGHPPKEPRLQRGWFIEPTVYVGVSNDSILAREEIFGPVLCVIPFKDEADAVRIANDSIFGLAAGIWSRDIGRVHRVAAKLEGGRIVVNEYGGGFVQNPCGGYKMSGYGREQGLEALAHYTQQKSVIIKL